MSPPTPMPYGSGAGMLPGSTAGSSGYPNMQQQRPPYPTANMPIPSQLQRSTSQSSLGSASSTSQGANSGYGSRVPMATSPTHQQHSSQQPSSQSQPQGSSSSNSMNAHMMNRVPSYPTSTSGSSYAYPQQPMSMPPYNASQQQQYGNMRPSSSAQPQLYAGATSMHLQSSPPNMSMMRSSSTAPNPSASPSSSNTPTSSSGAGSMPYSNVGSMSGMANSSGMAMSGMNTNAAMVSRGGSMSSSSNPNTGQAPYNMMQSYPANMQQSQSQQQPPRPYMTSQSPAT